MKNLNLYKIFAVLFIAISFSSCVDSEDYEIPSVGEDKTYTNLMSLDQIVALYSGSIVDFNEYIAAANLEDINTYGYVVSNDRGGNFFKTLIIQDKKENPTIGVEIRIDATELNARYNVGRKVYIKLKGLALGKYFTSFQLGVRNAAGTSVDRIEDTQYTDFIDRSSEIAELVPTTLAIDQITDAHINTLVRLENMQTLNEGEAFTNPPSTFSVNRTLKNCTTEQTIVMRTSGFADFAALQIPQKRGNITAILNKFSSTYQLFVRDLNDFDFNEDRCKPLYEENFQDSTDNTDLNTTGWTNFAETGTRLWSEQVFSGNGYAEFSGFRSGEALNVGWLISPGIDMDAQAGEVLTFKAAQHHVSNSTDNKLEILVSTDFDGTNVAAATWTPVTATLPTQDTSWYQFVNSGEIDLSSYTGTLYIAFKSTASGTNTDLDGSYMIDDVVVSIK